MQLPMVAAAERHRELIANFQTDCPRLGKAQVMGIAGLPATDQARLRGDKLQMCLVTQPLRFREGELALVESQSQSQSQNHGQSAKKDSRKTRPLLKDSGR